MRNRFLGAFFFTLFLLSAPAYALDSAVSKVIDGDTLILQGGLRVRLIGVDAPELYDSQKMLRETSRFNVDAQEMKELGEASKQFLERLLAGGLSKRRVILQYDKRNVYKKHEDDFGRRLCYIYRLCSESEESVADWVYDEVDGQRAVFINASLIRAGYAFAYYTIDYEYRSSFLQIEAEARTSGSGLWSSSEAFQRMFAVMKDLRERTTSPVPLAF